MYIVSSNRMTKSAVIKEELNQRYPQGWVYVDRHDHKRELYESPLANPFYVNKRNPRVAVEKYRRHLWMKIQHDDRRTLDALRAITPKTVLICRFTFNKREHNYASIIYKAAEYVQSNSIPNKVVLPQSDDIKTVMVSGHRDLTHAEFAEHYVPKLDKAIREESIFVVGDADGADFFAQTYLSERVAPHRVTVFHAGKAPRRRISSFQTVGGYPFHTAKDKAMTNASTYDIAWIRPGKETSGTAKNLTRRISIS